MRLAIFTEIIAPYRIPVFNALAALPELDLHVFFLSETDPSLRQWRVYKDEISFSYDVLPAWRQRLAGIGCMAAFVLVDSRTGKTMLGLDPVWTLDVATRETDRIVSPLSALWYVIFVIPFFIRNATSASFSVPICGVQAVRR